MRNSIEIIQSAKNITKIYGDEHEAKKQHNGNPYDSEFLMKEYNSISNPIIREKQGLFTLKINHLLRYTFNN